MTLIPESVMPHVKRFGFSGVIALGIVVIMLFGINPVSVLTGKVSPPPPPTSITGLPPADATIEMLAAYPPIVGGEAELMWRRAFYISAYRYPRISMTVASHNSKFGCGMAGKDLTVFYCPDTRTVYVDVDAYARLRAKHPAGADFAIAFLVAEAYGHHTQWKLEAFDKLAALDAQGDPAAVEAAEKRIDIQAACYAAMWTVTATIDPLIDMPEVMAAIETVEGNRDRAILDLPAGKVIPELLTRGSAEGRKLWYDKGYAIPAGGTCALYKIEDAGTL
jgi:predicted metalloprotease